jgi:hypothetical protein
MELETTRLRLEPFQHAHYDGLHQRTRLSGHSIAFRGRASCLFIPLEPLLAMLQRNGPFICRSLGLARCGDEVAEPSLMSAPIPERINASIRRRKASAS